MNRVLRVIIVSFTVLVLYSASNSQVDSLRILRDTSDASSSLRAIDSSESGAFHQKKSPWLAVGLSAAVPGLGQIYNENYWKAPVIWGVGGYWIYEWIRQNDKYKEFRDAYATSLAGSSGGNDQYARLRDFYRDERDRFAWFLGGLYLLNMVDAYVGAHLYDFDVTPDLGMDGRIVPKVTASLRLRF